MRSARLLAVTVLAVVLALSSAQNAFGTVELAYDAGTITGWNTGLAPSEYKAVRFSVPTGCSSVRVLTVRIYWYSSLVAATMHVLGSDRTTNLITPLSVTVASGTNWDDYNLGGVIVSGDFYVALEGNGYIRDSGTPPPQRSWYTTSSGSVWHEYTASDSALMIRALVDPLGCAAAVGGVVIPANTLALVAPWLAVIGLVGCIGIVVVVAKKRKK